MVVNRNKVKIITLGCSKNLVDSEYLMAQLKSNNVELVGDGKKCDTVIINTCGFIETAKKESIDTILKAVENKEKGNIKNLFVAGCLSERYKTGLEKEIPEVNKYFGSTDKHQTIIDILNTLGINYKNELIGERLVTTPGHFAYLKISDGCDNPCSFCAIPIMRGGHKSKPLNEIISEAKKLADKGVKEIIIIGQDTTYWGMDINKKRNINLVLNELSKIKEIVWIRLMYAYPSQFPMDVIDLIRDNEKLCKYIDIPIQHISDNILKTMRRGITKKNLISLLEKLRNKIPGIAIRTTLLVGHPGETEKDFEELNNFVKDFEFDRLGVFTYSEEEGTFASMTKDTISLKEKNRRHKNIMETQKEIAIKKNLEMIDKTYKVLIDRKENDYFIGRTYKDAPEIDQEVYISKNNKIETGKFYETKIFDYEEFDVFGEVIK